MITVFHSTETCLKCGKDSYRTLTEAAFGAKCFYCGFVIRDTWSIKENGRENKCSTK